MRWEASRRRKKAAEMPWKPPLLGNILPDMAMLMTVPFWKIYGAPAIFPKKWHHTVKLASLASGGAADSGIEDWKKNLHSLHAKPDEMSLISWRLINVSSQVVIRWAPSGVLERDFNGEWQGKCHFLAGWIPKVLVSSLKPGECV